MIKLFLVRHGEPDNPQGVIYSRLPGFPLTLKGREEARLAGEYLKRKITNSLPLIFSSPLLRARQTARIISRFFPQRKIILTPALTEVDFGSWTGVREEELVRRGEWQVYLFSPEKLRVGEGLKQAQKRVVLWVKKAIRRYPQGNWIIVSHRDIIRLLTLFLEKRPINDLNRIPCETGSVTTLVVDSHFKLKKPILYWEPDGFEG